MQKVEVYRIETASPDDVNGLAKLIDAGTIKPEEIVAILGKTEGNGCVNDFTRGFATFALAVYLAGKLQVTPQDLMHKIAFIMSGGTEGVMTPHLTVFVKSEVAAVPSDIKRLAVGVAFTRDFLPEELGRMEQVMEVARSVKAAMSEAKIVDSKDVHFVQIKCPLLTAERIADAHKRGQEVAVYDTYKSMAYSRGASALGVAIALGELKPEQVTNEVICHDWSLYSAVASTSAGVELLKDEIIVVGNSTESASELRIGHSVMQDAIDADAVRTALKDAGLQFECCPSDTELNKIINVLAKAEADTTGMVRGRRNAMMDDSDINHTRSARAVVNAVIASIVKDPMVYVSGGAEHQGPNGGGPIAVIAKI